MDRRHVVLGIVVAATLADSPAISNWASAQTDGPVFRVEPKHPTWVWAITYTAVLPGDAFDIPFDATVSADATPTNSDLADQYVADVTFGTCDPKTVYTDGVGELPDDVFSDCEPDVACAHTYCLVVDDLTDSGSVEMTWRATADIQGDDALPADSDVGLSITYEEIAP